MALGLPALDNPISAGGRVIQLGDTTFFMVWCNFIRSDRVKLIGFGICGWRVEGVCWFLGEGLLLAFDGRFSKAALLVDAILLAIVFDFRCRKTRCSVSVWRDFESNIRCRRVERLRPASRESLGRLVVLGKSCWGLPRGLRRFLERFGTSVSNI